MWVCLIGGSLIGTAAAPAPVLITAAPLIAQRFHVSIGVAALPGTLAQGGAAASLLLLSWLGDRCDRGRLGGVLIASIGVLIALCGVAPLGWFVQLAGLALATGVTGFLEPLARGLAARGLGHVQWPVAAAAVTTGFVVGFSAWRATGAALLSWLGLRGLVVLGVLMAASAALSFLLPRDPVAGRDAPGDVPRRGGPSWPLVALVGATGAVDAAAWALPISAQALLTGQEGLGAWLVAFQFAGVTGLAMPAWQRLLPNFRGAFAGVGAMVAGLCVLGAAELVPVVQRGYLDLPGYMLLELSQVAVWSALIGAMGGGSGRQGPAVAIRLFGLTAALELGPARFAASGQTGVLTLALVMTAVLLALTLASARLLGGRR
jgi:MFS family permease